MPEITRTFYALDRQSWRDWLERHHRTEPEIWLVSYRRAAGKPAVSYNDSVEEALCFGWIDSVRKALGTDRLAQRFTPRRPRSTYSQPNLERLRRMVDQGRVVEEVLPGVLDALATPFVAPEDILTALRADPAGWVKFRSFSEPYQRIRIAYVETARGRGDEFRKRLDHLLRMNAAGKQFGHGVESYY